MKNVSFLIRTGLLGIAVTLVAGGGATSSAATAYWPDYGILWHEPVGGAFGVWRTHGDGTVIDAYALTTTDRAEYPDGNFTCGTAEPDHCALVYAVTQIFSRATGFDFLSFDPRGGGMSSQSSNSAGLVTVPGTGFVDSAGHEIDCGSINGCAPPWKMVGGGKYGGAPALFWYNASTFQLGAWQLANDGKTVFNRDGWAACGGGSCAAYGEPIGVADFNRDGIADFIWRNGSSITVFVENATHGYQAVPIQQPVPGYQTVFAGVITQGVFTTMAWYTPLSEAVTNWQVHPTFPVPAGGWTVTARQLTWACHNCGTWMPVGLVPLT